MLRFSLCFYYYLSYVFLVWEDQFAEKIMHIWFKRRRIKVLKQHDRHFSVQYFFSSS